MEPLEWHRYKHMRRGKARRAAAAMDNALLRRYGTEWTGRVPWVCTQEFVRECQHRGLI
jgi:hypothetical protein